MATLGVAVFSFDGIKDLAPCLESVAWADRIVLLHLGADAPNVGAREMPALAVRRLDSWREADKYCAETGTDSLLYLWGDERLAAGPARGARGGWAGGGLVSWREADKYCAETGPDWLLYLWGDERLDAALARALREFRGESTHAAGVYALRVRSLILNQWVEGGLSGPSPSARLARGKENPLGWWKKTREPREIAEGWIEDYGTAELAHGVERVQALSDYWAARLIEPAAPPGALETILAAVRVRIKMLLRSRLFARGLAGIALAALASYGVLLSGAKLWEARHANGRG